MKAIAKTERHPLCLTLCRRPSMILDGTYDSKCRFYPIRHESALKTSSNTEVNVEKKTSLEKEKKPV